MNVLLTHGYFLANDPKEQEIMKPYPPLGILSIAAWLEQQGISADVFDTTFSTPEEFRSHLLRTRPDYIGIYTNLMTKLNVLEAIRFVRNAPELAHTQVILGGPEVTHHVDNFLAHGANAIVIGEGEEGFHELLLAYERNTPLAVVPGIAFADSNGTTHRTPERALIKQINDLPFPKRDAINLQLYLDTWKRHHGASAISVSTMRGCPYTCRWCSRAVYGGSYRRRSPALVVDEMEHIRTAYAPDALWFVDDVFTINPRWMREFAEEVTSRNVHIPYECITRADRLNEEMVELLKRSGCYRIWIGAESGSQAVLDAMDRRVTTEQVQAMIQLSKQHGIETGTFIMLGYPGETEEDILATIEHLKRASPDHFTVTIAYPIAGTPLYQQVQDILTVTPEWSNSTDRDIDFERPFSRKYYQYAIRRMYNEVHLHKLRKTSTGLSTQGMEYRIKALAARLGMALAR